MMYIHAYNDNNDNNNNNNNDHTSIMFVEGIIHRDLKPENILLASATELTVKANFRERERDR